MGFAGGMGSGADICIYSIWGAVLPHQRIDIKYDPQTNIIGILDYNHISATRLDRQIVEHISAIFESVYEVRVRFEEVPRSLGRCLGP